MHNESFHFNVISMFLSMIFFLNISFNLHLHPDYYPHMFIMLYNLCCQNLLLFTMLEWFQDEYVIDCC